MRRAGGYAEAFRDGVRTVEHDTFSCAHCNATVFLKAGADPTSKGAILYKQPHWQSDGMGVCLQCTDGFNRGLICPACEKEQAVQGGCRNFERRLEQAERRGRLFKAIGV